MMQFDVKTAFPNGGKNYLWSILKGSKIELIELHDAGINVSWNLCRNMNRRIAPLIHVFSTIALMVLYLVVYVNHIGYY